MMVRESMARAAATLGRIGLPVWMFSLAGVAQAQESAAPVTPPPADATAMLVFLFIFIAMIVAYIAWIFHQQKKSKKAEPTQADKT